MKLKRNVEATKRAAIVRHIQYRKSSLGKVTKYVQVHGHRKSQAMIQQWMKDYPMIREPTSHPPPSPLPSEISLHTKSPLASPIPLVLAISGENIGETEIGAAPNLFMDTPIERLLSYAHKSNIFIKSGQCGSFFNDFQKILYTSHDIPKCPEHDMWSPVFEEFLVTVRNWMNLTENIWVGEKVKESIRAKLCTSGKIAEGLPRLINHYGTWMTPYGRVSAVFKQSQTPEHNSVQELSTSEPTAVQITLHLGDNHMCPSHRIVLDLNPSLEPSATIIYQAILPNDSEIFQIIENGEVEDLIKLIETKRASLTDRDEQGRSLLHYAKYFSRVDFVRFFLNNSFDPNAVETLFYYDDDAPAYKTIAPVFQEHRTVTSEVLYNENVRDEEIDKISQCFKLFMEAGADLEMRDAEWSNFESILYNESSSSLRHVVQYGESTIHPDILIGEPGNGSKSLLPPLIAMAKECGYEYDDSFHILEKAIILLKWGADVSCQDSEGNTVLHRVLLNNRNNVTHNNRPEKEPAELLIVFLSAGADVYALNKSGYSASRVARKYGRVNEWLQALEFCGFNAKEVINQTTPKYEPYTGSRQTSKLKFEEYYQQWDEKKWAEKMGCLEEESIDITAENLDEEYSDLSSEDSEIWHVRGCECIIEEDSNEGDSSEIDDNEEECRFGGCSAPKPTHLVSGNVYDDQDTGHLFHAEQRLNTVGDVLVGESDHTSMNIVRGSDPDVSSTPETVTLPSHDPMLNDEILSTTGTWDYGALDHQQNLEHMSLAAGDFSEEIGGLLEDIFHTEFDAFITSS